MVRNKILLGTILVLLSLLSINIIQAQINEYPQITEQVCNECILCPEGLECINFPGIGLKCAEPNPCSYYQCLSNTECKIFRPAIAMICPDGTHAGAVPSVKCLCMGPECPAASGNGDTIEYNVLTQTEVHTINRDQTTSQKKITLWKSSPTNSGGEPVRGILETPTSSAEYQGKIIVKNSKMFMETSAGEKPINILPEEAIAKSIAETPEIKKVELIGGAEPFYSVKGQKQAKLIAIIPITLEIETKVSAETGDVISVNKPWWSFLTW